MLKLLYTLTLKLPVKLFIGLPLRALARLVSAPLRPLVWLFRPVVWLLRVVTWPVRVLLS